MACIPRQAVRSARAVRYASSSTVAEPLAFPHPALSSSSSGSTTRLTVRAFDRIPSSAHALAIVRAVEARCGTVINVEVPKDPGNMLPTPLIHITLLRPHTLPADSLLHEIPAPVLAHALSHPGGPSLADLTHPKDVPHPRSETLKFRIEARTTRNVRERAPGQRARRPGPQDEKEDRDLVESLKRFKGFSGRLDGLGRDFEPFTVRKKVHDVPQEEPVAAHAQDAVAQVVQPVVEAVKSAVEAITPEAIKSAPATPTPEAIETEVPTEPSVPKLSKRERLLAQARESAKANALRSVELAAETERTEPTPTASEPAPSPPAAAPRQAEGPSTDNGFLGKWFRGNK